MPPKMTAEKLALLAERHALTQRSRKSRGIMTPEAVAARAEKQQATVAARTGIGAGEQRIREHCMLAWSHRATARWFAAAALEEEVPAIRRRLAADAARFKEAADLAAEAAGGWDEVKRRQPAAPAGGWPESRPQRERGEGKPVRPPKEGVGGAWAPDTWRRNRGSSDFEVREYAWTPAVPDV